jgi:hypothetical protein
LALGARPDEAFRSGATAHGDFKWEAKISANTGHLQPEALADETANALPGRFFKPKTNCLLIFQEPGLFQSGFFSIKFNQ